MGKFFVWLQYCLPHHALSRTVAWLLHTPLLKTTIIRWFIRRYGVDLSESLIDEPADFVSFNAFFTRELRAGVRPIDHSTGSIVSPADGCVSQLGAIRHNELLQAKGKMFTLQSLLGGDRESASRFDNGSFATIYLSPKDYHRVHMPLSGTLQEMTYVPGRLFSVNPVTAANVPDLFARNERLICLFETAIGPMAVILVGAMIVASIETVWAGHICPSTAFKQLRTIRYSQDDAPRLNGGDELGRFKLGSTVIVLFAKEAMRFVATLRAGDSVRMGQRLGSHGQQQ